MLQKVFRRALIAFVTLGFVLSPAAAQEPAPQTPECTCPDSYIRAQIRASTDWFVVVTNRDTRRHDNISATLIVTSTAAPTQTTRVAINHLHAGQSYTVTPSLVGYLRLWDEGYVHVKWVDERGRNCATFSQRLFAVYLMRVSR